MMGKHVKSYFSHSPSDSQCGNFHSVIALHEPVTTNWTQIKKLVPQLPKGWYELGRLSSQDRIEFVRDFWLATLPFQPGFGDFVTRFFSSLEEVGIYLTQRTFDDPYEGHMVYSLKGDRGFFQGHPPASEAEVVALQKWIPDQTFPDDFKAFLRIHDGFAKFTDTGILPTSAIRKVYREFQQTLESKGPLLSATNEPVDPKKLIPFYESFGFPCYQCFWAEWYPAQEMGNVYYSGLTHTITDHTSNDCSPENQAFPTFLDWLEFYLEVIEA